MTVGDLDGDGALDLAVANVSSDDLSVLLGNGDGTFGAEARYGVGDVPRSVAAADLDGDGDLDLVVANAGVGDDISILLNRCSCAADLDGDGTVGTADLLGLLAAWGMDPGGPPDLDGDGHVGAADLLALLADWGRCS